jgi:hypothetical protein
MICVQREDARGIGRIFSGDSPSIKDTCDIWGAWGCARTGRNPLTIAKDGQAGKTGSGDLDPLKFVRFQMHQGVESQIR